MAAFDAAKAVNDFGLDLYRHITSDQKSGNLVFSPYSLQHALALAYAGAENETRREMAMVLHLPDKNELLAAGFKGLRESIDSALVNSRNDSDLLQRFGGSASPVELHVASRLYSQRDRAFRDSFMAFTRDEMDTPLEIADFRSDPEAVRRDINRWVAAQTHDRIQNLLAPDTLSVDSLLVLVNALYLKAAWSNPFWPDSTQLRPFDLTARSSQPVPTMIQTGIMGYARDAGTTTVSLEYVGAGLQFLVILPDPGKTTDDVVADLSSTQFSRWAHLPVTLVALELPKFRVEGSTLSLRDALAALGMRRAFDIPRGSANFSGIAACTAAHYFLISEVVHKAFIAVDENGTEVAAATAVAVAVGAAIRPDPITVRVDRPFLFAIQDRKTGTCLFLGRIDDPR